MRMRKFFVESGEEPSCPMYSPSVKLAPQEGGKKEYLQRHAASLDHVGAQSSEKQVSLFNTVSVRKVSASEKETVGTPMHFIRVIHERHAFLMILEMVTSLCLVVASASLGSKLKNVSCQKQFRDVLLLFLLFW